MRKIFIGYDARQVEAFAVCRDSVRRYLRRPIPTYGLVLEQLRAAGLYRRETRRTNNGQLWDVISDAPMATEFAITRFLIGYLAGDGYALFMDCDMLVRADLTQLFELAEADSSKAIWCVKHDHVPQAAVKMDGQAQTKYARKNWSSLMVWNVSHPANRALSLEDINSLAGRDLHRFCWLEDDQIGELEPAWNYLVGNGRALFDPKVLHYTAGGPWHAGFENVDYAHAWRDARNAWANSVR